MTYARRYALSAITGLYQDDDDGNQGSGVGSKAAAPEPKTLAPAALKKHRDAIAKAINMTILQDAFKAAYRAAEALNDKVAMEVLTEAKDERKATLAESQPA